MYLVIVWRCHCHYVKTLDSESEINHNSEVPVIPTTVFFIRTIKAVLVSIAHVRVVNTAVVRAQEVVGRARSDGRICQ